MSGFALISAIVLPMILLVGGIAAWRVTRSEQARSDPATFQPAWRDESMDDWRKERDAAAEAERQQRTQGVAGEFSTGRAEEQAVEKREQRLGG